MANLGLLQYKSASELRDEEVTEAQRIEDEQTKRLKMMESRPCQGAAVRRHV